MVCDLQWKRSLAKRSLTCLLKATHKWYVWITCPFFNLSWFNMKTGIIRRFVFYNLIFKACLCRGLYRIYADMNNYTVAVVGFIGRKTDGMRNFVDSNLTRVGKMEQQNTSTSGDSCSIAVGSVLCVLNPTPPDSVGPMIPSQYHHEANI